MGLLFHYSLLEVFRQVRLYLVGSAFGGDFGDVVLHHQLDKLLKAGLGGVPAQFGFGFGGVAPEVDDVGGTVEVLANPYHYVTDFQFTVDR